MNKEWICVPVVMCSYSWFKFRSSVRLPIQNAGHHLLVIIFSFKHHEILYRKRQECTHFKKYHIELQLNIHVRSYTPYSCFRSTQKLAFIGA